VAVDYKAHLNRDREQWQQTVRHTSAGTGNSGSRFQGTSQKGQETVAIDYKAHLNRDKKQWQ